MANAFNGNTWYVDTATTLTSNKNQLVAYIWFVPAGAGDSITLQDVGGTNKITVKGETANKPVVVDLRGNPMHFPNGIIVSALSASGVATLVMTSGKGTING